GLLHRFGQPLFFWQSNADESFNYRHRLAAAPSRLADNIHAATIFPRCFIFCLWDGIRRGTLLTRWEPFAGQRCERIMTKILSAVGGDAFGSTHAIFGNVC